MYGYKYITYVVPSLLFGSWWLLGGFFAAPPSVFCASCRGCTTHCFMTQPPDDGRRSGCPEMEIKRDERERGEREREERERRERGRERAVGQIVWKIWSLAESRKCIK